MAVDDANTLLLLHMDGDNDGTTFIDEAGKTVNRYGNTKTSTAQKKFGTASALFDGNADYLTISGITIGTGAFTIDFWYYRTGSTGLAISYGGSNTGFVIYMHSSGTGLYASGNRITGSATSGNAWHHCALVGNGAADGSRNIKMYIDGSLIGTWTTNYNYTKTFMVGANEAATSECFQGYIDEVRYSNIARWTANFTPPTEPYNAPAYKTSGSVVFGPFALPTLVDDPASSSIDWTADVPEDTTLTIKTAIVSGTPAAEDYQTATNGEAIPSLDADSSELNLYIKAELATSDTTKTPSLSALSFEIVEAENPYKVAINLTYAGRMKHPQGDVTVNFTGSMTGPLNAQVAAFNEAFVPVIDPLFFMPHDPEKLTFYAEVTTADLLAVNYIYGQASADYIAFTGATVTQAVLTHIDDLEQ